MANRVKGFFMKLARIAGLVAALLLSSSIAFGASHKATANASKKHHRHTAAMVHGRHHKRHLSAAKAKPMSRAKVHQVRAGVRQ
jgi:hypothetical protein